VMTAMPVITAVILELVFSIAGANPSENSKLCK
jgi:hypothetical protein